MDLIRGNLTLSSLECADLRNIEVVVFVLGKVLEELHQKVVVVECCLIVVCVVVHVRIVRVREANTHWGLHCKPGTVGDHRFKMGRGGIRKIMLLMLAQV